jgi:hypothetical protein
MQLCTICNATNAAAAVRAQSTAAAPEMTPHVRTVIAISEQLVVSESPAQTAQQQHK